MTDEDIRKIAKHMLDSRMLEYMPSRDKIQEIILGEVRRQAFGMYDREARVLAGETTRSEIRKQLKSVVAEWIETNVLPVIAEIKPNTEWLTKLITDEVEAIRAHIKHEVVKYSYDVEYDISVDQAMPKSGAATEPHYGYMRCTGTESGYQSMTPIRLSKA